MSSGFFSSEAVGTIDFIDHFDKLFDVLNSSVLNSPKEYRQVFTGSEKQIKFLEQMLHVLEGINVINDIGSRVKVRCSECWQVTIKSLMQFWQKLKSNNFPYIRIRRINQDCLENFFGSIRQQGDNCVNPMLRPDPGMDGPYGRTQLTYPVTHFIRACVWIGSNECEGPDTGQRPKVSLTLRF